MEYDRGMNGLALWDCKEINGCNTIIVGMLNHAYKVEYQLNYVICLYEYELHLNWILHTRCLANWEMTRQITKRLNNM